MRVLTERELEALYDTYLDDCHCIIEVCGYSYLPSDVLKSVDPVAYNTELSNYIDSLLEDGQYIENEDGEICEVE